MASADVSMPSMASLPQENNERLDLCSKVLDFYETEAYTDVKFQIKSGDIIVVKKGHKLVTAIWSPVFADMFFGPNAIQGDTVEIFDVTPAIFSTMLTFMYGYVCEINARRRDISFFVKLYKASNTYQIEALKTICRSNISYMVPDKLNVFQLLDAARLIEIDGTVERCIHFLESRTTDVLASQDLCNVSCDMMTTILNLKRVSFSSEFDLVMWLFAWVKNEYIKPSNTRSFRVILEDLLGHVDLTAMTAEDFGKLLRHHENVFSDREVCQIFRNIVDPGCCAVPDWANVITREYKYFG